MTKALVSIGIPAYKATYLKEAIDSVLNQTYTNLELIIVNDNSPEKIDDIVLTYSDKRIRYYKNENNLGKKSIVLNWNKCLSYANGVYFILLCDDDVMLPDFISEMLHLVRNYPQCNVFKTRTTLIDSKINTIIGQSPIFPEYETFNDFLLNTIIGKRKHTISEFLYKTQHIKQLGGYQIYPAGYYADDASILLFAKDSGIASTEKSLIVYRKSENNISSNSHWNVEKVKAALMYYQWNINEFPINQRQKQIIQQRLDFDLYTYFSTAESIYQAIQILRCIPLNIWSWKKKLLCLYKFISDSHAKSKN